MKHTFTGTCYFEGKNPKATVGDIFKMRCLWPEQAKLLPPLKWEIISSSTKKAIPLMDTYSLRILKTLMMQKNQALFEVTSYAPGQHQFSLRLVSVEDTINFSVLKWEIASVIPKDKKQNIQAYPPYGPWAETLPLWYVPLSISIALAFVSFIAFRFYTFFKRRKWIKQQQSRAYTHNPFNHFVSELILLERELSTISQNNFVQRLNKIFTEFLETEFLIPIENYSFNSTMHVLKLYYPFLYKKYQKQLKDFFAELNYDRSDKLSNLADYEQLLNMAREMGTEFYLFKNKWHSQKGGD